MHGVAPKMCKVSFHMLNLIESARGYTPVAWNVSGNFAFFMGAEEALRSVLRAQPILQHLSHLPATSPSPQLHRNVIIAATNSGLPRILIGGCDSARWLAWPHTNSDFPHKPEKKS